ncbi:MAG: hypothetical protein ABSE81_04770 [Candidatus Omnitrophota bacterium]|jgi:hypothetical protein
MDSHKIKQKKRAGKVIRAFKVEICDASSNPELYANPSNPYAQLSDEERLKDFVEVFGLLWGESCRETSKDVYGNKKDCNK